MRIKKAVIPVAGKGTRFLPATRAMPKELIPIIDTPAVDYAVREAHDAGIERVVFVTSSGKSAIEDYFERAGDQGPPVRTASVRQRDPLGLGHAILCAEDLLGGGPFAVLLADEVVLPPPGGAGATGQLARAHAETGGSAVVGVVEVPPALTGSYGIVDAEPAGARAGGARRVRGMVEKPPPDRAPGNLAAMGRYVLTERIFHHLRRIGKGVGGEYQLTSAIDLLAREEPVHALPVQGRRHDVGTARGHLEAVVDVAFRREDTRDLMGRLLRERAAEGP